MLFTEARYLLLFFPLCLVVHWALPRAGWRKIWLLGSSYVFYAAWDWRFLGLILASTVVDFAVGKALDRTEQAARRRGLLIASLGFNLGLLGCFKYLGFFIDSAATLLELAGLDVAPRTLEIVLPVGISFFTFQTMSYTIDVYRRRLAPISCFRDFALFVAFFPQLVAGPIVRAKDFLPQLATRRDWAQVEVRALLTLFLLGFIKKACIADNLSLPVDAIFSDPTSYSGISVWTGTLLYASQIYCDFSGYTDMAIACAGLLGYRLPLNFDLPYSARDLGDFWRRWHISLSSWLRDYLYIPLGGNRGGALRTQRNLMLTMLLGGLWHGAAWNFLLWGGLHGLGLLVARAWAARGARLAPPLATLLTLAFVCFAWIFFRAPDLATAIPLASRFLQPWTPGELNLAPAWTVLAIALLALHSLWRRVPLELASRRVPDWLFALAYGIGVGLAITLLPLRQEAFIYFQF